MLILVWLESNWQKPSLSSIQPTSFYQLNETFQITQKLINTDINRSNTIYHKRNIELYLKAPGSTPQKKCSMTVERN